MAAPLEQHQVEIERNRLSWEKKPTLRKVYGEFYKRIVGQIDGTLHGPVVELGSGIGNLKKYYPSAITTDLFPNPWLDQICDAYEMPFESNTVSHLVLFDVFHHLSAPAAFLEEARRVLIPNGRIILFEPYISPFTYPVYGLGHHEPIAMRGKINALKKAPFPRDYYAAQGNATRIFFSPNHSEIYSGWNVLFKEAFSSLPYLLSGGYSKPCLFPSVFYEPLERVDKVFSLFPRVFGARCIVTLTPEGGADLAAP
ncbi:MAG: methyltransferase [Verrucomicrobiales bacterium]|nr:methyltransferase [Verrucomicrobiales bacterium]